MKCHATDFLDYVVVIPEEVVITGDLNFHIDDPRDTDAQKFLQILSEHGLLQHVSGPTHVHGHTLDVLITRENSSLLLGLPSIRDPCICNPSSDHFAVFTPLNAAKLPKKRETVSFRKHKDIDVSEFKSDIQNSGLNAC